MKRETEPVTAEERDPGNPDSPRRCLGDHYGIDWSFVRRLLDDSAEREELAARVEELEGERDEWLRGRAANAAAHNLAPYLRRVVEAARADVWSHKTVACHESGGNLECLACALAELEAAAQRVVGPSDKTQKPHFCKSSEDRECVGWERGREWCDGDMDRPACAAARLADKTQERPSHSCYMFDDRKSCRWAVECKDCQYNGLASSAQEDLK